jgi:CRISPR-associated protein Cas5d
MGEAHKIEMEVSGKTAMWTRPDTGATPISYPVPPWSAAKGLFESISRLKNVIVIPTSVEICAPIVYHDYTTNYGGPLRKGELIAKGNLFQHKATVLINVCYRLYARIEDFGYVPKTLTEAAKLANVNSCHYAQERFQRRLLRGQYHDTPCLGWREFVPDYIGPVREDADVRKVQTSINETLPSFLYCVYDPVTGVQSPRYVQTEAGRRIVEGRLEYAE